MSANKIAETSTTEGTGNFALAGAWNVADSFITGNRTFNSFYGLNHRFPYMIQDKLGNWEKGVGYLSDAAVLVREMVTDNSAETTALIDFLAGEKLVMVPVDAGMDILPRLRPNAKHGGSSFFYNNGANHTFTAGRLALTPYLLKRPMTVSSAMVPVTTAVAATKVRVGIYQITYFAATHTAALVLDIGEVDSSTTGDKVLSVTDFKLAAGVYFIAAVSNGSPAIRGQGVTTDIGLGGFQYSVGVPTQGYLKPAQAAQADGLSSTINFLEAELSLNTTMPRILLGGQFL